MEHLCILLRVLPLGTVFLGVGSCTCLAPNKLFHQLSPPPKNIFPHSACLSENESAKRRVSNEGAVAADGEHIYRGVLSMLIADLIELLENIAPPDLADEDDRIGLQVGDVTGDVTRVCVSLDTTPAIIHKVIDSSAGILIAHHPLIYKPLASVTEDQPVARCVTELIRANVALFVMHTNYDSAPGGTNDILAESLGLCECAPLVERRQDAFFKIAVYVPEDRVEDIRDAMATAGAGHLGHYTHCSFRTRGIGSFVPLSLAQPYIGSAGKLEEVDEYKLEMVCAGSWLEEVLAAMIEKHPYDEVAYDVYELANEPVIYGYGRVGTLKTPATFEDFAAKVKSTLQPKYMKVEGNPAKLIKRVALCTGSGSGFYRDALRAGADVYITGDTKHHDILDANAHGLAIIDAGHYDTEAPAMRVLTERLRKILAGSGMEVEYIE